MSRVKCKWRKLSSLSYLYTCTSDNMIKQCRAVCIVYARMHLGSLLKADQEESSHWCANVTVVKSKAVCRVIVDSGIRRMAHGKYSFYEWGTPVESANGSRGKREINRREFIVHLNDRYVLPYVNSRYV